VKCAECKHSMKHHKQSGRCRKSCTCDLAALKAEFKRKRDNLVEVRRKAESLEP
jgi:hypothetical protein